MHDRMTERRNLLGVNSEIQGHIYYALFYNYKELPMPALHHVCGECDSEFTIKYHEDRAESDPAYCPFCGEMLIDIDDYTEDED